MFFCGRKIDISNSIVKRFLFSFDSVLLVLFSIDVVSFFEMMIKNKSTFLRSSLLFNYP